MCERTHRIASYVRAIRLDPTAPTVIRDGSLIKFAQPGSKEFNPLSTTNIEQLRVALSNEFTGISQSDAFEALNVL